MTTTEEKRSNMLRANSRLSDVTRALFIESGFKEKPDAENGSVTVKPKSRSYYGESMMVLIQSVDTKDIEKGLKISIGVADGSLTQSNRLVRPKLASEYVDKLEEIFAGLDVRFEYDGAETNPPFSGYSNAIKMIVNYLVKPK